MNKITVFAKITAKPEYVSPVLAELKTLVALVQQEPGHIQYKLHQDLERPEVFHFYEVWGSRELLDRHAKAAALGAFQRQAAGWLESLEVSITRAV
jgi:quinol monooxygenase YgiN